jgi:hypothetical protein
MDRMQARGNGSRRAAAGAAAPEYFFQNPWNQRENKHFFQVFLKTFFKFFAPFNSLVAEKQNSNLLLMIQPSRNPKNQT